MTKGGSIEIPLNLNGIMSNEINDKRHEYSFWPKWTSKTHQNERIETKIWHKTNVFAKQSPLFFFLLLARQFLQQFKTIVCAFFHSTENTLEWLILLVQISTNKQTKKIKQSDTVYRLDFFRHKASTLLVIVCVSLPLFVCIRVKCAEWNIWANVCHTV